MKISACVITKNEEKNINKYVKSLQPYVDEIIFVDTGSMDETVEIAKKYNLNIYNYQWENDFAAAKNYAKERASGDWIVFLDADEYFSEETVVNLKYLLEKYGVEYDAFLTKLINIDVDQDNRILDEFYTVRIFKNSKNIMYRGKIHEQLVKSDNEKLSIKVLDSELIIYHTGYSSSQSEEKAKRNLFMLKHQIKNAEEPEKYYVYLAETYSGLNEHKKAIEYAQKDIESGKKAITYASRSHRILIESLKSIHASPETIKKSIRKAIESFPGLPDFYAEYGLLLYRQNDYEQALFYFDRALCLNDNYMGIEPSLIKNSLPILQELLGDTRQQLKNRECAIMLSRNMINESFSSESYTCNELVQEIVNMLQDYSLALLFNNQDDKKWDKILPSELGLLMSRYFNQIPKLQDDNYPMYKALLEQILKLNGSNVLDRYLVMSSDFSLNVQLDIVKILYNNRKIKTLEYYFEGCSIGDIDNKEDYFFAGIGLYYKKCFDQAEEFFKTAISLGVEKKKIESYLVWIEESRQKNG